MTKLGWLETVIRGGDEVPLTIPNSELFSQQVSNLSRLNKCQVSQVLRFPLSDSGKLPKLVQDIKEEIIKECPELITNGIRPFRCYWSSYRDDHSEVIVDAHFRIPPIGEQYHENRQKVLVTINNAVKKNDMKFFERKYLQQ